MRVHSSSAMKTRSASVMLSQAPQRCELGGLGDANSGASATRRRAQGRAPRHFWKMSEERLELYQKIRPRIDGSTRNR